MGTKRVFCVTKEKRKEIGFVDEPNEYLLIPPTVKVEGRELTVTSIGPEAFQRTGVGNVVIFDGVKKIDKYAFMSCKHLTEVLLPKTLTRIEKMAFRFCTNLERIVLPEGLTTISGSRWSCNGYRCALRERQ